MPAYATLADLKQYGQPSSQGADPLLDPLLTWFLNKTSASMDNYCRQTLGYPGAPQTDVLMGKIDAKGKMLIFPRTPYVSGITAMSYSFDDMASTNSLPQTQALYTTDAFVSNHPSGAMIRMRNPDLTIYRGDNIHVSMTYQSGYQTMPDELIEACVSIAWESYKAKDNMGQGSAIPELGVVLFPHQWPTDAVRNLKPYRRQFMTGDV